MLLTFSLSHCISSCSSPFRSLHLFPLFTGNLTCTLFIIGWSLTASSHLLFYFIVLFTPTFILLSLFDILPRNTFHFLLFSSILQGQSRSKVTATKAVKVCALCSQWLTWAYAHTESAWMKKFQFGSDGGCSSDCVGLWRVVLPEGKSSGLCLLAFRFTSPRVSLTRPSQAAFTSSWTSHSEEQKYWEK